MESLQRWARGGTLGGFTATILLALMGLPSLAEGKEPDSADRDVAALADRIDRHLAARQNQNSVKPTRPVDDAEFLRRVSLDIGGRIPRNNVEMHQWLADQSPDKRRRLVERLLASPLYWEHFTNVWRHMLLPPGNNQQAQALANNFDPWLRKQFRENVPYDVMVRELLTAPLGTTQQPNMQQVPSTEPTPVAFYQINELKPENVAASASRLFLGIKLECAQCHNHPFASWKKKQFWEFAAFFGGIGARRPETAQAVAMLEDPKKRTIKIGGGDEEVEARFLDGKPPVWNDLVPTRNTLADWVTAPDNPYFARNAVNRLWAHFFGIGLIDPVDEPGPDNPPSHPELLEELTRAFVEHKFDVKFMIRAITSTQAYQLSSAATDPSQKDARQFARMTVKGMSGEQLFDSLAEATGVAEQVGNRGPNGMMEARGEFLAKFGTATGKRTEYQTSILQALSLMNGRVIAGATSLDRGRLGAVSDAPFWSTSRRIEELYLSTLARKPRPEELERLVKYVDDGGPSKDQKKALADVFWALLNSSEFIFNH
jgi:hypothetical protein